MSLFRLAGLLSVLSAITIYLPEEVSAFKRCPEHGSTDVPSTSSYPDEKFCNVYHTCNCTRTECRIVESHVCSIAKVYSRAKAICLGLSPFFSCLPCRHLASLSHARHRRRRLRHDLRTMGSNAQQHERPRPWQVGHRRLGLASSLEHAQRLSMRTRPARQVQVSADQ